MARMDWDGREARALFDSWLRLHLLDKDTVLDIKTIWLIRNLGDRDIITLCVMLCVSVSIFGRLRVVAKNKLKFEFLSPNILKFCFHDEIDCNLTTSDHKTGPSNFCGKLGFP